MHNHATYRLASAVRSRAASRSASTSAASGSAPGAHDRGARRGGRRARRASLPRRALPGPAAPRLRLLLRRMDGARRRLPRPGRAGRALRRARPHPREDVVEAVRTCAKPVAVVQAAADEYGAVDAVSGRCRARPVRGGWRWCRARRTFSRRPRRAGARGRGRDGVAPRSRAMTQLGPEQVGAFLRQQGEELTRIWRVARASERPQVALRPHRRAGAPVLRRGRRAARGRGAAGEGVGGAVRARALAAEAGAGGTRAGVGARAGGAGRGVRVGERRAAGAGVAHARVEVCREGVAGLRGDGQARGRRGWCRWWCSRGTRRSWRIRSSGKPPSPLTFQRGTTLPSEREDHVPANWTPSKTSVGVRGASMVGSFPTAARCFQSSR